MSWIGRASRLAAVLAIGMTVAGCSADPPSTDAEPVVERIPLVRSSTDLVLPLDAYRLSYSQYMSIQRASWRLTRACVARFGGVYTLPESALLQNAPPDLRASRRYGLLELSAAAQHGYDVPPDTPGLPTSREAKVGGWNPSEAELVLVRGAAKGANVPQDDKGQSLPNGGCSAEATAHVRAGAVRPADEDLSGNLAKLAYRKAENDSRVQAAMSRWSECMRQGGYSYRTIWEPNDKDWSEPPGNEEIATATADVKCKQSTNLVGIWYAVEVARQKKIVEDRSQDLEVVRTYLTTTVRNAARLASGA